MKILILGQIYMSSATQYGLFDASMTKLLFFISYHYRAMTELLFFVKQLRSPIILAGFYRRFLGCAIFPLRRLPRCIVFALRMGKKQIARNNEDGRKSNLVWNLDMDGAFIDCMLEEQTKGNRADGTWTSSALANIVNVLKEKVNIGFTPDLNKEHLKNRMKTMKANFNVVYELFRGLSGFSWNPTTEMFEAENEVWNELLKDKLRAYKWRHTKIPNYEKLYELFSKDRATGQGSMTASEQVRRWAMEGNSNQVDINSDNDEENPYVDPHTPNTGPTQVNNEATSSSRISLKRKAKVVESNQLQLEAVNTAIDKVAASLDKTNTLIERSTMCIYSVEEVYNKIEDIGVLLNWRMETFLFLTNNQSKARQFFGFPKEHRLELLVRMMQP